MVDTRYTKERREETKPRMDETKLFQKDMGAERITVMRSDTTRTEDTERQIYPQERDVSRVVIEELAEEERQKYPGQPTPTEVAVARKEVLDIRPCEKDVIKVGKLDLHDLEKTQVESTRIDGQPVKRTERVERSRKACLNKTMDERREVM